MDFLFWQPVTVDQSIDHNLATDVDYRLRWMEMTYYNLYGISVEVSDADYSPTQLHNDAMNNVLRYTPYRGSQAEIARYVRKEFRTLIDATPEEFIVYMKARNSLNNEEFDDWCDTHQSQVHIDYIDCTDTPDCCDLTKVTYML